MFWCSRCVYLSDFSPPGFLSSGGAGQMWSAELLESLKLKLKLNRTEPSRNQKPKTISFSIAIPMSVSSQLTVFHPAYPVYCICISSSIPTPSPPYIPPPSPRFVIYTAAWLKITIRWVFRSEIGDPGPLFGLSWVRLLTCVCHMFVRGTNGQTGRGAVLYVIWLYGYMAIWLYAVCCMWASSRISTDLPNISPTLLPKMAAFVNVPFVDTLEIPLIPKYFHFVGNFKKSGKSNYITYQVLVVVTGFYLWPSATVSNPYPKQKNKKKKMSLGQWSHHRSGKNETETLDTWMRKSKPLIHIHLWSK